MKGAVCSMCEGEHVGSSCSMCEACLIPCLIPPIVLVDLCLDGEGALEHGIDERGLAVIDVRHDRNVTQVVARHLAALHAEAARGALRRRRPAGEEGVAHGGGSGGARERSGGVRAYRRSVSHEEHHDPKHVVRASRRRVGR